MFTKLADMLPAPEDIFERAEQELSQYSADDDPPPLAGGKIVVYRDPDNPKSYIMRSAYD